MRLEECAKLRALQWELAEHSTSLARAIGATLKSLIDSFTVECDDMGPALRDQVDQLSPWSSLINGQRLSSRRQ